MIKNLIIFSLGFLIYSNAFSTEPSSTDKKTESTDSKNEEEKKTEQKDEEESSSTDEKKKEETEEERKAREEKEAEQQEREKQLRRYLNQFIPQNLTINEKIDLLEEQLYKANLRMKKLRLKLRHIQNDQLDFISKSFKFNNKAIRLFLHKHKTAQKDTSTNN